VHVPFIFAPYQDVPIGLPQFVFLNFACGFERQLVNKYNLVRQLPTGDFIVIECQKIGLVYIESLGFYDLSPGCLHAHDTERSHL
jgi:hypothetical protein